MFFRGQSKHFSIIFFNYVFLQKFKKILINNYFYFYINKRLMKYPLRILLCFILALALLALMRLNIARLSIQKSVQLFFTQQLLSAEQYSSLKFIQNNFQNHESNEHEKVENSSSKLGSNQQFPQNDRNLQTVNQNTNNSVQYINNGRFSITACSSSYCIWNKSNYQPTNLPYWFPDPQIEIGWVNSYKSGYANYRIIELGGTKATCIKQVIQNIPNAIYELKYTFAPRAGVPLLLSTIFIYLNGTKIEQRLGLNYEWNDVTVSNLTIKSNNQSQLSSTLELKICGDSLIRSMGNLLSFVSLKNTSYIIANNMTLQNDTKNPDNVTLNNTTNTDNQNDTTQNAQITSEKNKTINQSLIQNYQRQTNQSLSSFADFMNEFFAILLFMLEQTAELVKITATLIEKLNQAVLNLNIYKIYEQFLHDFFQFFSYDAKRAIQFMINIVQEVDQTPASRNFIVFLSPMFSFFDDYVYYVYHDHSYDQLNVLYQFLIYVNIISAGDVTDFIPFDKKLELQDFNHSNYTNYTHPKMLEIDQRQTYFLLAMKQTISKDYFMYIVIIVFVKLIVISIAFGLKFCNHKKSRFINSNSIEKSLNQPQKNRGIVENKNNLFKTNDVVDLFIALKEYLYEKVTFKGILAMFIGSNMILISFNFSSQLRIMFSFQNIDMTNIFVAVTYGFLTLGFICLFFVWDELGKTKTIQKLTKQLSNSKEKRLILYDTYFVNLKNLLNGFVHGLFIDDPTLQYVLLMLIKFGLIYIVICKKKLMKQSVRVSVCVYFLCGILIDVMCLLSMGLKLPTTQIYFVFKSFKVVDLLGYLVILLTGATVVFQIMMETFQDIKAMKCFKKHVQASRSTQSHELQSLTRFMLPYRIAPNRDKNLVSYQKDMRELEIVDKQKIELNKFTAKMKQQKSEEMLMKKIFQNIKFVEKEEIKEPNLAKVQNSLKNKMRRHLERNEKESKFVQIRFIKKQPLKTPEFSSEAIQNNHCSESPYLNNSQLINQSIELSPAILEDKEIENNKTKNKKSLALRD